MVHDGFYVGKIYNHPMDGMGFLKKKYDRIKSRNSYPDSQKLTFSHPKSWGRREDDGFLFKAGCDLLLGAASFREGAPWKSKIDIRNYALEGVYSFQKWLFLVSNSTEV